jgi:hypothetical protein
MKLRIHGNSIRLRLGPSEVRRLLNEGEIQQQVQFGPSAQQRLVYCLRLAGEPSPTTASLDAGKITVSVSADAAHVWASTEQIAIEGSQTVGGGVSLKVLVEKDFECLDDSMRKPGEEVFARPAQVVGCATRGGDPHA